MVHTDLIVRHDRKTFTFTASGARLVVGGGQNFNSSIPALWRL